MPKPNFKQGKPVAELLVAALLAYATDDNWVNLPKRFILQSRQSPNGLRIRGNLEMLQTLVNVYAESPQYWIIEKAGFFNDFSQQDEKKQIQALKNAYTCLRACQIIEDQGDKNNNTTNRHFLLKLQYHPTDQAKHKSNLNWLFGENGQWNQRSQKETSPLVKWTRLLPYDISKYILDQFHSFEDLIGDLAPLVKSSSSLDTQDKITVLEKKIPFYLANENHSEVKPLLNQFKKLLNLKLSKSIHANYYHYSGVYHHQKKNYHQAKTCFDEALSIGQQSDEETKILDSRMGDTLHNLACVELARGNLQEAEHHILKTINIRRSKLPQSVVELVNSLITLAHIRSEQGRFTDAEFIYQQLLKDERLKLGEHLLTAHIYTGLGHIYARQGQNNRARECYNQAIGYIESLYGVDSSFLAIPKAGLRKIPK